MQRHPLRFPAHPRLALAVIGGGVLSAGLLTTVGWLLWWLAWPQQQPPGNPEWGINFSCRQMEYLQGLPPGVNRHEWCASQFDRIITGLSVEHVRLSVYWDEVERRGRYDFSGLDALLAVANTHHVDVLLTVGIKSQRHPEFYIPRRILRDDSGDPALRADGAVISDDPAIGAAALAMVEAVVRHVAENPAVTAWQADNEPYIASPRAHNWTIGRDFVQEEVRTIRAADPLARPVVINHAGYLSDDDSWRPAVEDADVMALDIYPFRRVSFIGISLIAPILEIGPLIPNYPWRGETAREAGKGFWITEMQAEPWAGFPELADPATPRDITPGRLRQSIEYARRSGASRVYLWGAEWWLYRVDLFDDSRYWDIARGAISGSGR